jgi:hypothetical protein
VFVFKTVLNVMLRIYERLNIREYIDVLIIANL